jgi:hypothetical protein
MNKPIYYRFSPHPHLCYTSLQKCKDAALDYLEYIGYEPGAPECIQVESWDGGEEYVIEVEENCDHEELLLSRFEIVD